MKITENVLDAKVEVFNYIELKLQFLRVSLCFECNDVITTQHLSLLNGQPGGDESVISLFLFTIA